MTKINKQKKPNRIWRTVDLNDPKLHAVKYDLLLLRDMWGEEQIGWFTGSVFEFFKKRIDKPVEWKRPAERSYTGHSCE